MTAPCHVYTDWTGPTGRLGKMKFRMRDSVFPEDQIVFTGTVTAVETDSTGCTWVDTNLTVSVGDRTMTTCEARVAVPTSEGDNPWQRRGDDWQPEGQA